MDTARLVWQGGIAMMRQLIRRGLILGAVVVGSTGCETLHSMVRSNDKDEVSSKDDAKPNGDSDAKGVDSDDNDKTPFFKTTRSRSAWSSFSPEAQSIEKDLGVY
jgi:hypothetical protein